jgi:membrane protein DedA with SNARE-associated domain
MLESFLADAQHYVVTYGYWAVFLGVFLESFGLPTPGETLMIAGALAASQQHLDIYWILLIAWVAAVVGDNIGYIIGSRGGRPLVLRYGGRVGIKHAHIEQVEDFFARYGGAVVLFARFVVVLRQLNGVVAGILGMNWWRFLAYNAAGAALWVTFWSLLAYWFGRGLIHMVSHFEPIAVAAIVIGGACVVLAFALYRRRRNPKPKRRR